MSDNLLCATRTIEVVTGGTHETILKYFAEAEQDSELKVKRAYLTNY
jgi:hypothetical protein